VSPASDEELEDCRRKLTEAIAGRTGLMANIFFVHTSWILDMGDQAGHEAERGLEAELAKARAEGERRVAELRAGN